jgi:hypothetical protein
MDALLRRVNDGKGPGRQSGEKAALIKSDIYLRSLGLYRVVE